MKKYISKLFLLVIILSIISSCKKEEETSIDPYNCTANIIADQIAENTLNVDQFSYGSPIEAKNGSSIILFDNLLDQNGNEYTGQVNITLVDAQDNKNMLLMGYPTITNTNELLVSGGICFFNPTDNNGNPLFINPNGNLPQLTIPNSTNNMNEMTLYIESENNDGEFVWVETNTNVTPSNPPNSSFTFSISNTGGVNMDYPLPPCTGSFNINLPSEYNGSNSSVFIYYTNRNSVIRAYDNDNDGNFIIDNMLCSEDSVQFVIISQINGIREYHVSDQYEIPGNWNYTVAREQLEIRLCDEAVRLSIKDELIN